MKAVNCECVGQCTRHLDLSIKSRIYSFRPTNKFNQRGNKRSDLQNILRQASSILSLLYQGNNWILHYPLKNPAVFSDKKLNYCFAFESTDNYSY